MTASHTGSKPMENARKKIIVDICGADADPSVLLEGALSALADQNEYDLVLVGPEKLLNDRLGAEKADISERCEIIAAEEFVTNFDNPAEMARGKSDTSMAIALKALKTREDCAALISAGSTGCLLVGSIFRLGLFGKLMQPALSSALYNTNGGFFCLVDCGANVNSKAKDILDYAHMGSAYMEAAQGISSPRVGLVNVGKEPGKGSDLAKAAFELLENDETINFIGNIEGSDILNDTADVIVCDGFTGNVILKSLEAAGLTAAGLAGNPESVIKFFDYNSQGGATFLGTKKIIVKAHGAANESTIKACINQAWSLEKGGFTEKMKGRMA